ncbi:MAG: SDR family oxidoreductase [Pseudomonadales bacterium]|jgi:NAD(P)-dependent dehydrogenase (short-subunit alcohol dehydrogenase family)|nr:SDR family oxidoreductase [Pseudomonadales bacterium]MDP6471223.1 SDR family oxidoreductase [Pseudomonadales bacterium]MDP6825588.1 SDR family oxidoreductase [Pseudomonadales bacterium]MDP6972955.1 SDR family oxidoreductase [Pseudomonadales bacterium]|tara:strand:- start:968 stop:1795 length:828 start_codon:yes stop_codon:yes gene_type:complete
MQGRRVLITGGNSGIGIVAAAELAALGAEVVLACRDGDKTRAALDTVNAQAAVEAINLPVDLASLTSVRDLARGFLERYDRLDVLINNAGTFPAKQRFTKDGFEMQMGVNHFAHFLLTHLLLDCLKASAPARIVTVTSTLHRKGSLDFDTFRGFNKYSAQAAYNQSKLANVLFAVELSHKLDGTGVTSNYLHPGAVATDIIRDMPWIVRKLIGLAFTTPEKGARTTIMLASDDELAEVTGRYYDQCQPAKPSPLAEQAALRECLWRASLEAVGLA